VSSLKSPNEYEVTQSDLDDFAHILANDTFVGTLSDAFVYSDHKKKSRTCTCTEYNAIGDTNTTTTSKMTTADAHLLTTIRDKNRKQPTTIYLITPTYTR
jgi:hypothetical protein